MLLEFPFVRGIFFHTASELFKNALHYSQTNDYHNIQFYFH